MKERPILFSSAMVLALLDGKKTQTRRIVKGADKFPNIIKFERAIVDEEPQYRDSGMPVWFSTETDGTTREWGCKFGEVSDRLYVRETWAIADNIHGDEIFYYKADSPRPKDVFDVDGFRWKPSIHMPHVVSRIRLDIVGIRVERLQDISEEDAIAEGIEQTHIFNKYLYFRDYIHGGGDLKPIESFRSLWESIDGVGSWNLNPWLWVVKFKKVENGN